MSDEIEHEERAFPVIIRWSWALKEIIKWEKGRDHKVEFEWLREMARRRPGFDEESCADYSNCNSSRCSCLNHSWCISSMLPISTRLATLFIYLLASLAIFTYERSVTPLYASYPTRYLVDTFVLAAIVGAAIIPTGLSTNFLLLVATSMLSLAPISSYLVASRSARWRDPLWGPAVTHLLVVAPIVYMFALMAIILSGSPRTNTLASAVRIFATKVGITFISITQLKKVWSQIHLYSISDRQIFFLLAISVTIIWANTQPTTHGATLLRTTWSKFYLVSILVGVGALTSALLHFDLTYLPRGIPYTHPSYPLRILSVKHSVTGLIVVGEGQLTHHPGNDRQSIRYLRAAHSILGGVWTDTNLLGFDEQDSVLGDSIYSAFVLQDAARLVNSTQKGSLDNALIIGLGIGTSASAFMKQNISTTIVEIDPAVYAAARNFFAMQDPGQGRVFLQDARVWVKRQQNSIQPFDIIIHDCFSGGGVPQHIFTLEFWEELKLLIHPEGVIAVNYAGNINSKPARAVLATLEKAFGSCRAFHDSLESIAEDKYDSQFVNLVFFCTPAARPLTFRQDTTADHLGSPLRAHILASLASREIDLSRLRSKTANDEKEVILTDRFNPLGKWQESLAFEHWRLMREVLPDVFWETY